MKLNVESIIKNNHLKNTKLRRNILQLLYQLKKPVDAITLTRRLKVNKTSIYRQLKVLLDKKLIVEIEFGDGKKRYELSSLDHHHHLICMKCHLVIDVKLKQDLHAEEKRIEKENLFKIKKHNLEFFGYCQNCQ